MHSKDLIINKNKKNHGITMHEDVTPGLLMQKALINQGNQVLQ